MFGIGTILRATTWTHLRQNLVLYTCKIGSHAFNTFCIAATRQTVDQVFLAYFVRFIVPVRNCYILESEGLSPYSSIF